MTNIHDSFSNLAAEALTQPPDSYFGNDNLWHTHGMSSWAIHRDSNLMDQSNWKWILGDIESKFGSEDVNGDWYIVHATHWAVGWVDQLMVRILIDPDLENPLDEDNITDIFKWCIEQRRDLELYPIFDEFAYGELVDEECIKNLKSTIPSWISVDSPEGEIYSWLLDNDFYPEGDESTWFSNDEVAVACFALGFIDPDDEEDMVEDLERILNDGKVPGLVLADIIKLYKEN